MSLDVDPDTVASETTGAEASARSDLQRATQLFDFETRPLDLPYIENVWRTRSEPAEAFISVAVSHWEMVVTRQRGRTYISVRGPETKASIAPIPEHAEFLGIQFRLGTFMPHLPARQLVDGSLDLPAATGRSFWLHGSAWDLPGFDDAEVFVRRLIRQGLLVHDPLVEAALQGHTTDRSERSVQRRVVQATGLTQRTIRQIVRAQQAADLLDKGVGIAETVTLTGYADQAHLTRSLKRFMGQTPGQIVHARLSG